MSSYMAATCRKINRKLVLSADTHLLHNKWRFWRPKACVSERHSRIVFWTPSVGCKHKQKQKVYLRSQWFSIVILWGICNVQQLTTSTPQYKMAMNGKAFRAMKQHYYWQWAHRQSTKSTRVKQREQHRDLFFVFSAVISSLDFSCLNAEQSRYSSHTNIDLLNKYIYRYIYI